LEISVCKLDFVAIKFEVFQMVSEDGVEVKSLFEFGAINQPRLTPGLLDAVFK
jgi:hypothetical protein